MRGYKKKQLEMFHSMDTEPQEWDVCEPIRFETDENGRDIPVYQAYVGYQDVKPYFASLSQEERDALIRQNEANKSSRNEFTDNCQACGHGIIIPWQIKHDNKKYTMIIGSECIENFMEQDTKEILKRYKTKQILESFSSHRYESIKDWSLKIVDTIWHDNKFGKKTQNGKILRYRNSRMRLEDKYHALQSELYRTDYNKINYAKLIKLIKKVRKAGLDIPDSVLPLIPKDKTKH